MNITSFKEKIFSLAGGDFNTVEVSDDNFGHILDALFQRFMQEHADGAEKKIYELDLVAGTTRYTLPDSVIAVVGYYKVGGSVNSGMPTYQKYMYEQSGGLPTNVSDYAIFQAYMTDMGIMMGMEFDFHFSQLTHQLTVLGASIDKLYLSVWEDLTSDFKEDIYEDEFFTEWVQGYFMKQWWRNIKKYGARQLIGGGELNLDDLRDDADTMIEKCELRLTTELSEEPEPLF